MGVNIVCQLFQPTFACLKICSRATTRFSVTKPDQGSIIALRGILADLRRFVILGLVASRRQVRHFKDLFTPLPLRRRFKQRGVLFVGYLEAGLGLGESLRGLSFNRDDRPDFRIVSLQCWC